MDPLPILLIKSNNNAKLEKYCVKNTLRTVLKSEKLDPYEFKMAFFDNSDTEEFLFFIRNFQITLEAPGTIAAGANIQYIRTLVNGKSLRQLDKFSVEVVSTTS